MTRRDVARLAGVSETIVSYVLNNNRYVAADKRQRVLDAVKQLNYRPNSIARSLKGKSSSHILFIADKIENEYFGRLVREIDKVAYDKGYLVSLMAVRNNEDFISRILSRQVDAIIVSSTGLEDRYIQMLIDAGIPIVLLMTRDYATVTGTYSRIYTGVESGIMSAVRLLYDTGCRHMVYVDRVSQNNHFSGRNDLRFRGFSNQLAAYGLEFTKSSFVSGCASFDAVHDAVLARLASGAPVDSFICRNDQVACSVLSAVKESGRLIPDDISIVGFDNSSLCTLVHPQLTSLERERPQIAVAAMTLIEDMIQGNGASDLQVCSKLILRGTTRPLHP